MVYYPDLQIITNREGSSETSIRKTSFQGYPDFLTEVSTLAIYPKEIKAFSYFSLSLALMD